MKPAISVHNLSKQYRIGKKPSRDNNLTENIRRQFSTAWDKVSRLVTPNKEFEKDESFWALKDVSFEVQPGEVVGIIGRNGAGKSTLLKILSQIVEPTSGHADIRGRMGSLLEVGTGFHPELTGRENIYLNGAILGMKREEITKKFDEIVAFAEVEKFLDTPVKRYSSGMYVRLAFAVAAHLEPEILVVDEVLAVGDQAFQQKCARQMREVGEHGRTILFVSHNMPAVLNLCTRCIWLKDGQVLCSGPTDMVLKRYSHDLVDVSNAEVDLEIHRGRSPGSTVTMRRVRVVDDSNEHSAAIPMRGTARIEVDFSAVYTIPDITLGVVIKDQFQSPIFGTNSKVTVAPIQPEALSAGCVVCRLPDLPLMPGTYSLDLYFGNQVRDFDVIYNAAELTILPVDVFGTGKLPPATAGNICWPAYWELLAG